MRKKNKLTILSIIFTSLLSSTIFIHEKVFADNYLSTSKNYYSDVNTNKGFLDEEITKEFLGNTTWEMFQKAVSNKLVKFTPGMTFNQYFLANDISTEDNFTVYPGLLKQLVKLNSGAYLNANTNTKGAKDEDGKIVDYITYVGPTRDKGAYWGDKKQNDPSMFSRLTVGNVGIGEEKN